MHVISKKALRVFWAQHPGAEGPLRAWLKEAEQSEWSNFAEVRGKYAHADQVDNYTIFNIGGNKYRLIVVIHFDRGRIYVRHVLTHEDYNRGKWRT